MAILAGADLTLGMEYQIDPELVAQLPTYTVGQLALRNGQDKPEIWVAYQGVIYDVSLSRLWKNGKHYEHWAGQDLTPELKDAPHSAIVFDRMKPIGRLVT